MIKRLIAIRLKGASASALGGKDKNGNLKSVPKGKIIGFGLLYAFLALVFLGLIFSMAAPVAMILLPLGGENLYFGIFMLLSITFIFVFSIFETKSELYECKDNELLLAMPIRPRDIVISRICVVLIYNYIEQLIFMLPVIACYMIFGGSIFGFFGSVYVFLTLPIIATVLAMGVGYAVHLLSHKLARFRNLIIMLISLGFLALYFIGYTLLMENMEGILENLENNFEAIAQNYSFVSMLGSVATLNPIAVLLYTVSFLLLTSLTIYVISKKYLKLITSTVNAKKAVYVAKELKGKNQFFAFTKKEFLKFISSPSYMLNAGLAYIFQIAAAILIAVLGPGLFAIDPQMLTDFGLDMDSFIKMSVPIFISILVITESMSMISASAVSLEGKNLWILKSMPVSPKTVLLAKAMPQIILSVAFSLVSGLIAAIGIGAGVVETLFFILIPMSFGILTSFIGIITNVLLPKLEFVNEVQVIKQSAATFVSMMVNMLLGVLVMVVTLLSVGIAFPLLLMLLILFIISGLSVALYFVTIGPIAKRFSTFT